MYGLALLTHNELGANQLDVAAAWEHWVAKVVLLTCHKPRGNSVLVGSEFAMQLGLLKGL